jgi:hypothetical protein
MTSLDVISSPQGRDPGLWFNMACLICARDPFLNQYRTRGFSSWIKSEMAAREKVEMSLFQSKILRYCHGFQSIQTQIISEMSV